MLEYIEPCSSHSSGKLYSVKKVAKSSSIQSLNRRLPNDPQSDFHTEYQKLPAVSHIDLDIDHSYEEANLVLQYANIVYTHQYLYRIDKVIS